MEIFETNLEKWINMTRFMFRYVKNNFQEGFQPYFIYVSGKVRVGAFREKHLSRFQA
jgi:hypothetical protein